MKKRYVWIGEYGKFKCFTSYKKMLDWASDENHDGTYYISCTDVTFKKTREQVLIGV